MYTSILDTNKIYKISDNCPGGDHIYNVRYTVNNQHSSTPTQNLHMTHGDRRHEMQVICIL